MSNKNIIIGVVILLLASSVWARYGFTLMFENSLLAGNLIFDNENRLLLSGEDFLVFDENLKGGGRILLVFRYNLNRYLSFGFGSGTSISQFNISNKVKDFYNILGINHDFSAVMFYFPIFGEIHRLIPIEKGLLYLFGSVRLGGSFSQMSLSVFETDYSLNGGLFFESQVGLSLNRGRFLFDFGIGYSRQRSKLVRRFWQTMFPDDWYLILEPDTGFPDNSNFERVERFNHYHFTLQQFSLILGFRFFFGRSIH